MSNAHQKSVRFWVVETNQVLLQWRCGQMSRCDHRCRLRLSKRISWLYRKISDHPPDWPMLHHLSSGAAHVHGRRTCWSRWNRKNRFDWFCYCLYSRPLPLKEHSYIYCVITYILAFADIHFPFLRIQNHLVQGPLISFFFTCSSSTIWV